MGGRNSAICVSLWPIQMGPSTTGKAAHRPKAGQLEDGGRRDDRWDAIDAAGIPVGGRPGGGGRGPAEGKLGAGRERAEARSEEHTSELQSLMRISYAVFCLKKKKTMTYIAHAL